MELEYIDGRVIRIPLPLPIPGLGDVNAYAILGDDGVTLIDPGWATPISETTLVRALHELGLRPHDVTKTLVTHAHWDHVTQAAKWRRELGTPLYLGQDERFSMCDYDPHANVFGNQLQLLERAGALELASSLASLRWDTHGVDRPFSAVDQWLSGGEEIRCGGRTVVSVSTPGHTRGHLSFEDREHRLIFSGDHILPHITPSVSMERNPQDLPLRSYLDSLTLVLDRADARLLPAHGPVTASIHARAKKLLAHHEQRLDLLLTVVGGGATTALQAARRITWTRRRSHLKTLEPTHAMYAVIEVQAHLDLLVHLGWLTSTADDVGVRLYHS